MRLAFWVLGLGVASIASCDTRCEEGCEPDGAGDRSGADIYGAPPCGADFRYPASCEPDGKTCKTGPTPDCHRLSITYLCQQGTWTPALYSEVVRCGDSGAASEPDGGAGVSSDGGSSGAGGESDPGGIAGAGEAGAEGASGNAGAGGG